MTIVPLLLALGQNPTEAPDPRLDVKATLEAPRLTYAELGSWVQQKTKVAIYVSPAIRERKVTVLVEDRPVKEIMDRISEALFVVWERTKDGYTMKIDSKVQGEEAAMAGIESSAAVESLRWQMNQMAQIGHKSKDSIKQELDGLNGQLAELSKDTSPEGLRRRAELGDRAQLLSNAYYSGFTRGMDIFASQISSQAQSAILNGTTIYGTNRRRPGFISVSNEATTAMHENSARMSGDREVLYSVKYTPATQEVNFSYGMSDENGASGGGQPVKSKDSIQYRRVIADSPLGRRLKDWAVTDPKLMATKLAPKKIVPEGKRQTTYKALAEVLVELHERTGLPIIADGYRQALVSRIPADGPTLLAWNQSLGAWSDNRYRGYRPLVRTGGDWVMMRHPQYWQRITGEVPEGPIRRLETACKIPGKATIDDFATFATAVKPAQEPYIGADWLVMDAPSAAFDGKLNALRLWASLPTGSRQAASSEAGLDISALQNSQQRLALACLNERAGSVFGMEKELRYFLPGAAPLPRDLHFFVNLNSPTMNMEYQEFVPNETDFSRQSWNSMTDSVDGVYMRIGNKDVSLASYSIPLRPSRKIWPDS